MSDINERESFRDIFLTIFPWLARFGLSPSGALAIKSAISRTELEGGGAAVMRVGDRMGYWYAQTDPTSGAIVGLFFSPTKGETAWAPDTFYAAGQLVQNGLSIYSATTKGHSAASGGPTGHGANIVDGIDGLTWTWVVDVVWTPIQALPAPPLLPGLGTPLNLGGPGSPSVTSG